MDRSNLSAERLALLANWTRGKSLPPAQAQQRSMLRADRSGPIPLSFNQQQLWFFDKLEPGNVAYNNSFGFRFLGDLQLEALTASLDEVVRRHEILRTVFAEVDSEPVQIIQPPRGCDCVVEDLSVLPADEREAAVRARAFEDATFAFDLRAGPLFRARLLRLDPSQHALILVMHHIVSDGWSFGVLVRELGALYWARVQGQPSPLPELPTQYADYTVWQRARLSGARLEREMDYWRARLAGVPPLLELPTDRPRPAVQRLAAGGLHEFVIPAELTQQLQSLAREEGATLFMVLLAGFQTLLGRYSGQDDVVVGTLIAGRLLPELEGLVGYFTNTLAMRGDLSGNPSFRELLRRVRETALEAYDHQELPIGTVVQLASVERTLRHNPLFQVMLGLQNQNSPRDAFAFPGLRLLPLEVENYSSKLDLSLTVTEGQGALFVQLEYATDLFEPETMERVAEHLMTLLAGAVAESHTPVGALPLLGSAERKHMLEMGVSRSDDWSVACRADD